MKAKKSFGQHFLHNKDLAARIADSLLQAGNTGCVLEVGPGMGMLTQYLLEKPYTTFAVEADRDMVAVLTQKYPTWAATNLMELDFLDFSPLGSALNDRPFCLIGNFPYNISTQILFWTLEHRAQIPEMVGMFQKEVADRVAAPPGSKVYGITSVIIQAFFEVKYLITVEPGNFNPPPKVRSSVIRLTRKEDFDLGCSESLFREMVKTSFGQRRKMLRNTLKPFFPNTDLNVEEYFQKRPENLSWEDFVALVKRAEAEK